ncbi:32493_t:CDS:2 [Gigaspora margarita]|uniref:32493_t:CDS:1 n=1 Tax=Gigaspora margarita TaxID=4874 RepID=A0ABN7UJA6_GIGMA|nr:32493_t:CDS:2 [Gigaspora margarita]
MKKYQDYLNCQTIPLNTTDNDNSITPAKARWKLLSSIISSSDTNSLDLENKVENVTLEKKTLTNSEIHLDNHTPKERHEWYSYYLDDNDYVNIR